MNANDELRKLVNAQPVELRDSLEPYMELLRQSEERKAALVKLQEEVRLAKCAHNDYREATEKDMRSVAEQLLAARAAARRKDGEIVQTARALSRLLQSIELVGAAN